MTETNDDPTETANVEEAPKAQPDRMSGILSGPGKAMTDQEQMIGRWLALATAVFFLVYHQVWLGGEGATFSAFGVGLSMLLWLASRYGNRIVTAVASYGVFFGPWGDLFIIAGIPIGFAFLLGFRASREAGQARAAERSARRATGTPRPGRKKKGKTDDGRPSLPVTEANRRYTPPKPKRRPRQS